MELALKKANNIKDKDSSRGKNDVWMLKAANFLLF